jgi:glycosyltransferase involved in cell wall biosynthesis
MDPVNSNERSKFGEVGMLALVADRWSLRWMSRHQFLTRLSRYFPVVWVNPAEAWRDALQRRPEPGQEEIQSLRHFTIYDSRMLPKFHRPKLLAEWFVKKRLQEARNRLIQQGCKRIVLYLWRPEFGAALRIVPHDLSCYHIVDEYSFSESEVPIGEEEREVINRVDRVFVGSPGLMEKKGWLNPRTTFVPNGVSYDKFSAPLREPRDLAAIPHPRIGYIGYLKKMLDWQLLSYLSRKHPSWSFVLVGSALQQAEVEDGLRELRTLPNVHILGAKWTPEFPAYAQHCDVCIMPYRATPYSGYTCPLKLQEYLASGRPVVATRIRTLEDYSGAIRLAETSGEWSTAISRALEPKENQPEKRAERQAIARLHDWDLLTERVARILAEHLGLRWPESHSDGDTSYIPNDSFPAALTLPNR